MKNTLASIKTNGVFLVQSFVQWFGRHVKWERFFLKMTYSDKARQVESSSLKRSMTIFLEFLDKTRFARGKGYCSTSRVALQDSYG